MYYVDLNPHSKKYKLFKDTKNSKLYFAGKSIMYKIEKYSETI
jgi:hypothetical protein